nr:hypothetical protein GCM10020093_117520 [Planobispora longispora]
MTTAGLLSFALLGGTAAATTASAAAAPAPAPKPGTVRKPAGQLISGHYIVVLKNGTATTATAVRKQAGTLTTRRGGKVSRTFAGGLKGFTVRASETQARLLAGDPSVAYVEQDAVIRATDVQNDPTWGLDRLDQRAAASTAPTPTLDRRRRRRLRHRHRHPLQPHRLRRPRHRRRRHRRRRQRDQRLQRPRHPRRRHHRRPDLGRRQRRRPAPRPRPRLQRQRLLSGVIAGVDWVTQNATGPSVANMSLGGGASTALDDAVRRSVAAGVTYVVAAGNSARDACTASPARVPEALTVGATTSGDTRASFSNYGRCLDLFAPGANITSAWSTGDTATGTISGTSMAAPHVAGAAALHLATTPTATPAQVAQALTAPPPPRSSRTPAPAHPTSWPTPAPKRSPSPRSKTPSRRPTPTSSTTSTSRSTNDGTAPPAAS